MDSRSLEGSRQAPREGSLGACEEAEIVGDQGTRVTPRGETLVVTAGRSILSRPIVASDISSFTTGEKRQPHDEQRATLEPTHDPSLVLPFPSCRVQMPILNEATLRRLLGSIEADHLVFLCGAGLSIPAPSNLMSAVGVARACYERWYPTEPLPSALRDDIDGLAAHFHANHMFKSVFIPRLVPWDDLVGEPNNGHAAVADLLTCRAAHAALSANFDPLIEQWCQCRKVAMRGALTGAEAVEFRAPANPLLKFHGCFLRGREDTLWTQAQLKEPHIHDRVEQCSAWMAANLPGKDLLIVGFWSDWGYLNDVLANAMRGQTANSVTVVDPRPTPELRAKAPVLWSKMTGAGGPFVHVEASGNDALKELRTEFSRVWARKFFQLSQPFVEAGGGAYDVATVALDAWTCDDLYDLRRDAEGRPHNRAAKSKAPAPEAANAAYAHVLLAQAGAVRTGSSYAHKGVTIRVVHGAGQTLETVRERFKASPALASTDIVICAGAQSVGIPATVIAKGVGASIVRPASGGGLRWLTLDEARTELQI